MMWKPERCWEGQDAFVIGGGASLRGFDFDLLKGRNTVGCNDAFRLGESICKVCIFGDASWFHRVKFDLEKFNNPIFSVAPSLNRLNLSMLQQLERKRNGLHPGNGIGWNFSTGGSAVNLAINMGAKRVFLLGIDLRLTEGKSHWHDRRPHPTRDIIFQRFLRGFQAIHSCLRLEQYKDIEIIHVIDGASAMPFFRQMTFREFHSVLEETKLERMEVVA